MHIHVHGQSGEAKFWLEPEIELALNYGFSNHELAVIGNLIKEHEHEIRKAWNRHFNS